MDKLSLSILTKVWGHSQLSGNVWMPSISHIGAPDEKFSQRPAIRIPSQLDMILDDSKDWYWTPAVSLGSRRKEDFPAQRVLWVDCDDGYDHSALRMLHPSIIWRTSPGHVQAIWLMAEAIPVDEYSASGLQGLLASVTKADKSGVDIGQLLRVPASYHHKKSPFKGVVLKNSNRTYSVSDLLYRICMLLGFTPQISSEISQAEPFGDRSKQLWKFASLAASLEIPKDIAFKLLRKSKWNKWKDNPELLKKDISKAYQAVQKEKEQNSLGLASAQMTQPSSVETFWEMHDFRSISQELMSPISWVIPQIIPESGCGFLIAPPKIGKTRVAIEMMLGCATAITPLGIPISRAIPTGFFSLEDGMQLVSRRVSSGLSCHRREYHWFGFIDLSLTWHSGHSFPGFISFEPMDLSLVEDKEKLAHTIQKYKLKFIIIDTLSMAIGKEDINNSQHMYSILKDIKKIAQATSCAIMFIHHTRKKNFGQEDTIHEKILGSTALYAWSDFILGISKNSDTEDILMQVQTKMGSAQFWLSEPDLQIR